MQTYRAQPVPAVPAHRQDGLHGHLQAVMGLVTEVLAHRALAA
jgi:hypothetical protein